MTVIQEIQNPFDLLSEMQIVSEHRALMRETIHQTIASIEKRLSDPGLTVLLGGKVPIYSKNEFIVGLEEYGVSFNKQPSPMQLYKFIIYNWAKLASIGFAIGGWFDRGLFYLDVVIFVEGREFAIEFGLEESQESIFCPYTGEVIDIASAPFSSGKIITVGNKQKILN